MPQYRVPVRYITTEIILVKANTAYEAMNLALEGLYGTFVEEFETGPRSLLSRYRRGKRLGETNTNHRKL